MQEVETEIRYGGWTYFVSEDRDDDCVKIIHIAVHETGARQHVPHTPYQAMIQTSFEFHVRNHFKRMGAHNWYHDHIRDEA